MLNVMHLKKHKCILRASKDTSLVAGYAKHGLWLFGLQMLQTDVR